MNYEIIQGMKISTLKNARATRPWIRDIYKWTLCIYQWEVRYDGSGMV